MSNTNTQLITDLKNLKAQCKLALSNEQTRKMIISRKSIKKGK